MAAERKLKGEIDRTLKKVQEGQEVFEGLWVQVWLEVQHKIAKFQGIAGLRWVTPIAHASFFPGPRLRQQQPAREAGGRVKEGD